MNILAINGSHRGDTGQTRFLIDRLFEGAVKASAQVEVISLAKKKINRCLSCGKCQTAEHHLQCVWNGKDDVAEIFAKMAAADVVVYATPIYVFHMSGLMKTFIDRFYGICDCHELRATESGLFFHHIDRGVLSKPFVLLACCDNLEAETPKNVIAYFQSFSKFMDAPQVGMLARNGGELWGRGSRPDQEKAFPKISAVIEAYRQAGRELAQRGRISRQTQRKANQEILPVPFFGLLKRLPFKPLKQKMVEAARKMRRARCGAHEMRHA